MTEQTPDQVKGHMLGDIDALIASSKQVQQESDDTAHAAALAAATKARDEAVKALADDELNDTATEAALTRATTEAAILRAENARLQALLDAGPADPDPVAPPTNLSPPAISDTTPVVGQLLAGTKGQWTGDPELTVEWLLDGSETGVKGDAYTAPDQPGKVVGFRVEAVNAGGDDMQVVYTAPITAVEPPVDGELPGWKLTYTTTFGQVSDLNRWTVANNQTQSNDNSINLARNVTTGPRGLTIVAKREAGLSRPFSSGEILGQSAALIVGNYFRAEVTGTFRDEQGVWPALLWFRPQSGGDSSNGEIDVMEWMGGLWSGDQKRVAITMHNEYGSTQDSIKKPLLLKTHTWFDPAKPHTYTIEKVPGSITVWVDARKIATFSAADKSWWNRIMESPERTWYPRITSQVGDGSRNSGGKKVVPDPAASFVSTEMTVSSFKLWKQT